MYDRATGKPTHQITKGDWYVRDVVNVDEADGKIYFPPTVLTRMRIHISSAITRLISMAAD